VTFGYPLQYLFGSAGLVFGAFLGIGLVHKYAQFSLVCSQVANVRLYSFVHWGVGSSKIEWIDITWFTAQGFALLGERLFLRATGKRVGGVWGNLWVWVWLVSTAQLMSECTVFLQRFLVDTHSCSRFLGKAWAVWSQVDWTYADDFR
jgi:hypothetical protein